MNSSTPKLLGHDAFIKVKQWVLLEALYCCDFYGILARYDAVIARQPVWRQDIACRIRGRKARFIYKWRDAYENSKIVCIDITSGEVHEPTVWHTLQCDFDSFVNALSKS